MFRYILRRLLLAIPTLLVISIAIFGLSKCAPRDPQLELGEGVSGSLREQAVAVRERAAYYKLDKPVFYCTLTSAAFPDTLHRVFPYTRREYLSKLCVQAGNWPAVARYETALWAMSDFSGTLPDTSSKAGTFRLKVTDLLQCEQLGLLNGRLDSLRQAAAKLPVSLTQVGALLDTLQECIHDLQAQAGSGNMYRPVFHWHGLDNQYHRWLAGFVTGDWGLSFSGGRPVWESIRFALFSTMIINGLAILLAYGIAIPLGVAMARRRDKWFDRVSRWILLFLYSMPAFWMGTLLILLFATPGWGFYCIKGIDLLPYRDNGQSYGAWCLGNWDKFFLPILTLSVHALAVLALQMRGGILDNIGKDYIRTARAKGVSEDGIYWRHAFRNALFPIITVFASVFPAIFAGSLVVEYLFRFPGLGMKTHTAFTDGDYPVLFAVLMFAAALTVAGNLIADLLYAWADPRVRFAKR